MEGRKWELDFPATFWLNRVVGKREGKDRKHRLCCPIKRTKTYMLGGWWVTPYRKLSGLSSELEEKLFGNELEEKLSRVTPTAAQGRNRPMFYRSCKLSMDRYCWSQACDADGVPRSKIIMYHKDGVMSSVPAVRIQDGEMKNGLRWLVYFEYVYFRFLARVLDWCSFFRKYLVWKYLWC
jgi:hypothetical protein